MGGWLGTFALLAGLLFATFFFVAAGGKQCSADRRLRGPRLVHGGLLFIAAALLVATLSCGGGGGGGSGPPPPPPVTFTITVEASGAGVSSAQSLGTITVTVD